MTERSLTLAARSLSLCTHPYPRIQRFTVEHAAAGAGRTMFDRCQMCGSTRSGAAAWVPPVGVVALASVLRNLSLDGARPPDDADDDNVAELLLLYACEAAEESTAAVLMPRRHLRALVDAGLARCLGRTRGNSSPSEAS